MTFTAIALALAIGLSMGILGGGGSIIAVPALTFLMHFAPKDAVITSLAIVGSLAAIGALAAAVRRMLPLRLGAVVGGAATVGAYAGAMVGARLADRVQLSLLGAIMFVAAFGMWRKAANEPQGSPRTHTPLLALLGVSAGAMTGLVGVGGGFLIVPALVLGARLPFGQAAATSLFVITLAAVAAIPGYRGQATLDWAFVAPFVAVAAGGVLGGGMVAQHLPQRRLQQAFATALIILGSYVLAHA